MYSEAPYFLKSPTMLMTEKTNNIYIEHSSSFPLGVKLTCLGADPTDSKLGTRNQAMK